MTRETLNDAMVEPEVAVLPRIQDVFLLVNSSKKMGDRMIARVNEAVHTCINDLSEISAEESL